MLDLPGLHAAIYTHIDAAWDETAVVYPNKSKLTSQGITDEWIRLSMLPVGTFRRGMGYNGRRIHRSLLVVDIFIPLNEGSGRAEELAGILINEVCPENAELTSLGGSTLKFEVPSPKPGGDDRHGYWMMPVHFPWYTYFNPIAGG